MKSVGVCFGIAAAAFVLAAAGAAQAEVTLVSANVYTSTNNSMMAYGKNLSLLTDFNNIPSGTMNFSAKDATFTGAASVENGTTAYAYQTPRGDTSNYLADGTSKMFNKSTNNVETISFSQDHGHFGTYWGSMDRYNTLTFFLDGKAVGSFTGMQALAGAKDITFDSAGNSYYGKSYGSLAGQKDVSAYVSFDGRYDKVTLSTTQPNFEIDNVAVGGVPEPGTWAMMLIGFGGLGFAAFKRSQKTVASGSLAVA